MATNIAVVSKVVGNVYMRDAEGNLKQLQPGMEVPENANIITANGASIELQPQGPQSPIEIGEGRQVTLRADVAQSDVDPVTNAATPLDAEAQAILTALDAGEDPFADLDPTAAVLQAGGDGAGGSSFTRLASIIETTNPLAIEYPRPELPRPEEVRLGGVRGNAAPELTLSLLDLQALLDQLNNDSDVIAGINVGQYFSDPDGDTLTFSATGLPPGLTIDPNTGIISGTIDKSASQGGPNDNGIYNVVITANDGRGGTVDLPFTWTTLNPPPVALDDYATTEENTIVEGNIIKGYIDEDGVLQGADHDPDGDDISVVGVSSITNPDDVNNWTPVTGAGVVITGTNSNDVDSTEEKGGGEFTIYPDGSYTFNPGTDFDYLKEGETTKTTISYQISDGEGGFDTAILEITVTGTNDVPEITSYPENAEGVVIEAGVGKDDDGTITPNNPNQDYEGLGQVGGQLAASDADEGETETLVWGLAQDPDNINPDSLSTTLDGTYGFITLDESGKWVYTLKDNEGATQQLKQGQTETEIFTAVVKDVNGAYVTQTITVTVQGTNDIPVITSSDDDAKGTIAEDADSSVIGGTLTSEDVDADDTATWNLVDGQDADGNDVLVDKIEGIYGHLELNESTGQWEYHLDNTRAETNALKDGETVTENFTARVTDSAGAYAEQEIIVTINGNTDGEPSIAPKDGNDIDGLAKVHEKGLVDGTTENISDRTAGGTIEVNAGDGIDMITITGKDGDIEISLAELRGLSQDNPIHIDVGHGTITLDGFKELSSVGGVSTSGLLRYEYVLTEKQTHSEQGEDSTKVEIDLSVTSVGSLANPDGGVTTNGKLVIEVVDDIPIINKDESKLEALVVDESFLGKAEASASADFAQAFDYDFGADGAAASNSVVYGFDIGNGGQSGLFDTLTGQPVGLVQNGNTILGKNDDGDTVFTITINPNNGQVTLEQERPVKHPDPENHDESVLLDSESLNVTLTVTDGDGDITKESISVGGQFEFKDDGPTIDIDAIQSGSVIEANLNTGSGETDITKTTITGGLGIDFGSDGGGDTYFTNDVVSKLEGLDLTSDGEKIEYNLSTDGHSIVATANGKDIFTVTLTDVTGNPGYIFELKVAIDHPKGTDDNTLEEIILDLPFVAEDGDGDIANGEFNVTVVDDPGHGDSYEFDVDEDGTYKFNTSADGSNNSVEISEENKPIYGTVTIHEDGSITYKPNPDFSGEDEFTYTTTEDGVTTTTVVKVTVNPVADAPIFAKPDNVETFEDEAVALGFTAPVVKDGTDQTEANDPNDDFDYPERLGGIELSGFPAGSVLLLGDGTEALIQPDADGKVVIKLIGDDAPEYLTGLGDDNVLELTVEQFESLQVLPPAESSKNFDITSSVTSYEVNKDGIKLPSVDGATTTVNVNVVVKAVTDPIKLDLVDDLDDTQITFNEDTPFDLAALLKVSFPDNYQSDSDIESGTNRPGDGNTTLDMEGSEERWFEVKGLPEGSSITSGNKTYTTDDNGVIKVPAPNLSTSPTDMPEMQIIPPKDFSGTVTGIEVSFVAQDRDGDSSSEDGDEERSTVELTLHINPIVDGVKIGGVSGDEDNAIKFLTNIEILDIDGSEEITRFVIKGVPADWIVKDGDGNVVPYFAGLNSPKSYVLGTNEDGVVDLSKYEDWTVTPPAHSSEDFTFKVDVTVKDTATIDGETVTDIVEQKGLDLKVTVNPVAEIIEDAESSQITQEQIDDREVLAGSDTDDLRMTKGYDYTDLTKDKDSSIALEDGWLKLNVAGVDGVDNFDLTDRWYNADGKPEFGTGDGSDAADGGTEETFALLTPILVEGFADENATGAKFSYIDDKGNEIVLTFNGKDAIEVPVWALDTLKFQAPEHVSGKFDIRIQAKTVDYDADDSSIKDAVVSGQSWLTGIIIKPVADGIDSIGIKSANGLEDQPIELSIKPTSLDPSEIFNIKISDIPTGSKVFYDGNELTVADGTVIIENYDSNAGLSIQPPHNSNNDFVLKVQGQTVDTVVIDGETYTDTSPWMPEDKDVSLHVNVKGVADDAEVTTKGTETEPEEFTEGELDGHGGTGAQSITLNQLVNNIKLHDNDGSEILSIKISDLPEGFNLTGDNVIFMGGEDAGREWVISIPNPSNQEDFYDVLSDILEKISISTPEHFSGKLPGTITAITTENDGDSKVGDKHEFNAIVNPTPESTLNANTTIDEDTLGQVNFGIADNKGDDNEELTAVYIRVDDVEDRGFTLYLGNSTDMPLANAGVEIVNICGDDYYKVTGEDVNNIYAQADANFAHNEGGAFEFDVKYEVTDYSSDGLVDAAKNITDNATHSITVKPITDPVEIKGFDVNGEPVADDGSVDVNNYGDFSVGFTIAKAVDTDTDIGSLDTDGSELFTQVIIKGVPQGMVVDGITLGSGEDATVLDSSNVVFLGNNQWLVNIPTSDAAKFEGDITGSLQLKAGELLSNGEHALGVTVVTQDTGAENVETDSKGLTIDANITGDGDPLDEVSTDVIFKTFQGIEDTEFSLSSVVGITINNRGDVDTSLEAHYSVIVKLPEGAQIFNGDTNIPENQITSTLIDGEEVWVISGFGDQDKLNALLDSLTVIPPADLNDNKGGMPLDVTVTTYLDNGSQNTNDDLSGDNSISIGLTPVTDGAIVDISFNAVDDEDGNLAPEEGKNVAITLGVRDDVDVDSTFGDYVYLKLSESGDLLDEDGNGGILKFGEQELSPVDASEIAGLGLEPGTYYKVAAPDLGDTVTITYIPAEGKEYTSGDITIETWIESTEKGADNTVLNKSDATGTIEAINNGFVVEVGEFNEDTETWVVTGDENQFKSGKDGAIELNLEGGLVDVDGSEQVIAAKLEGIPNGFLVYVNGELASNAGGDGTNTWLIPVDGNELPKISILPPQFWSGTINNIELSVLSGEQGNEQWGVLFVEEDGKTWENSFSFDLKVDPVASGIESLAPTTSFSDASGVINLNLNITLVDRVDATVGEEDQPGYAKDESLETIGLSFAGLGENAIFILNGDSPDSIFFDNEGGYTIIYRDDNNVETKFDVKYDEDGNYIVTGLSPEDANNLGIIQTADQVDSSGKVTVNAWTIEGDSQSSPIGEVDFDVKTPSHTPNTGTDGDDIIIGGAGNETLIGGEGNDIIYGGDGNDTIVGGPGNDILVGGAGNDTFVWNDGDAGVVGIPAVDRIMDFGLSTEDENGKDTIDLSDLLQNEYYTPGAEGDFNVGNLLEFLYFSEENDNAVINISSKGDFENGNFDASQVDQKIVLDGVSLSDFAGETDVQSEMIKNLIEQGKINVDHN